MNSLLYPSHLLESLKRSHTSRMQRVGPNVPKFVFLCGKFLDTKSFVRSNRGLVRDYIQKYGCGRVVPFLAEDLSKGTSIDLLTFEHYISSMSDHVVLFLESMGTAAELGAFALQDQIVGKMLVVIDQKYENDQSFINGGPVKRIVSRAGTVVYTDLESVFGNDTFARHLKQIVGDSKSFRPNLNSKSVDIATYLLEILDIIAVSGPISRYDILDVYKYVKDFAGFEFSIKSFKHSYAVDCLVGSGAINCNKHGYVDIGIKLKRTGSLMFDIEGHQLDTLRMKFMARKYRHIGPELLRMKDVTGLAE